MGYTPKHAFTRAVETVKGLSWKVRVASVTGIAGVAMLAGAALPAAGSAATTSHINTPERSGNSLDVWQQSAYVGAALRVYKTTAADPAEQWVEVNLTGAAETAVTAAETAHTVTPLTPAGGFQLEYAPGGLLSGLCVSTVTDSSGAYAELRDCETAGVADPNQDFIYVAATETDGFSQIEAITETTPYFLNVKGWAVDGYVISYGGTGTAENQIWETTTP